MKFILGQKKQMTQLFKEDGAVIPVTVVEVMPNIVTQVKTKESDGYYAVQVGTGVTKSSHRKPQLGHLKDLPASRWLKEVRFDTYMSQAGTKPTDELMKQQLNKFERGFTYGVEIFRPGDAVSVSGTSKGKGFQGVVKRHGFKGAPKSHGTKDQVRMPGSIGATGPAHVFKGMRMPGRMGSDTVTVDGLQVVKVDQENNLLYIKGAVPGAINSLVTIIGPGTFKQPKVKTVKSTEEQTVNDEVKDILDEEVLVKGESASDGKEEAKETDKADMVKDEKPIIEEKENKETKIEEKENKKEE